MKRPKLTPTLLYELKNHFELLDLMSDDRHDIYEDDQTRETMITFLKDVIKQKIDFILDKEDL